PEPVPWPALSRVRSEARQLSQTGGYVHLPWNTFFLKCALTFCLINLLKRSLLESNCLALPRIAAILGGAIQVMLAGKSRNITSPIIRAFLRQASRGALPGAHYRIFCVRKR